MGKMAKNDTNVDIAPLRSLNDFILESARFQIPNMQDPDRWAKRIVKNLLYYQTNYFITALIVFLVVGLIHPVQIFFGFLAVCVAFGLFYYFTLDQRPGNRFKHDRPILSLALILTGGYFIIYWLGSVIVFVTGILIPFIVILIHASMRMRNVKNKIANNLEMVGLQRTPMGLFLQSLGHQMES
ncbi:hypothetical protein CHUAL_012697 [Chamberlinius hualienensis]